MFSLLLFSCVLLVQSIVLAQPPPQYTIHNNCPQDLNLVIAGAVNSVIHRHETKFLGPSSGFFYTDVHGGNTNSVGTLRAGFFLESYYYYLVKDPNYINIGISIAPRGRDPRNGWCQTAVCNDVTCTTAFSQPPTRFGPPPTTPPTPPLYACPFPNTVYDIVFCPTGNFPPAPPAQGRAIHPNGNNNKCLDVRGAVYANGTPVQIYDCNGTGAQKWIFNSASTKVRVAGTNFCLDAGSTPGNGVGMKIWQCYDNLAAQQWHYADNRIVLEGKGQCLDLTGGNLANSNRVQTWQCTNFNVNQIWTV